MAETDGTVRYHTNGKQVLHGPEHFADARNAAMATDIANAMNVLQAGRVRGDDFATWLKSYVGKQDAGTMRFSVAELEIAFKAGSTRQPEPATAEREEVARIIAKVRLDAALKREFDTDDVVSEILAALSADAILPNDTAQAVVDALVADHGIYEDDEHDEKLIVASRSDARATIEKMKS